MPQLVIQRLGRGHAQHQGFDHQQATRHQRVALERHAQGEDELDHQQPACDHGTGGYQYQRVEDQEQQNGRFVPARRVPKKISDEGLGQ
ncbi:hypothetical protein D3C86_1662870 [compost metagenome]